MKSSTPPEKGLTLASQKGTLEQIGHEADMAWSGVKKIMALLNVEMKHVYYNNITNVTQAGTVLDLTSLISQGVGGSQRIGDSLKMKRVRGKFTFKTNPGMTTSGSATFVLGMSRDGPPLVSDVFYFISGSTSGLAFPKDTTDKADFWKKERFINVNQYEPQRNFELEHVFNHDVLYADATANVASGCVWLAFIGNEPTNFPTLDMGLDIEFLDN